jgi:hypothetical protein
VEKGPAGRNNTLVASRESRFVYGGSSINRRRAGDQAASRFQFADYRFAHLRELTTMSPTLRKRIDEHE